MLKMLQAMLWPTVKSKYRNRPNRQISTPLVLNPLRILIISAFMIGLYITLKCLKRFAAHMVLNAL